MLSGATNFIIEDGHFINVATHNHLAGPTGIDILLEASIPGAAHDSSARDPPPRCFPGTRKEYVEDIIEWAVPLVGGTPAPIYWMKGPAGVGKSAVAQSCIEKLERLGKQGPAFFFSINGRNKYQKFFPSIAYQLATLNSDYRDLIDGKIRRDRTLVDKTMRAQFQGLIVKPLRELEERGLGIGKRIPVLVDGLDECESQDAQCEIIEIVASAARDFATPLCWAFFSRPEPHIEATFRKADISPFCLNTVLPISHDADGDIELYLRAGFDNILRHSNVSMTTPWPSHADVRRLVRAAGGLFIYAKTVIRFVGQPYSLNPDELLCAVLAVISGRNQGGSITQSTFAELDAFYMLIMQRIPTNLLTIIQRVLAALCWKRYRGAMVVANYLGISRVELEAACNRLSSVVHFQCQHEPLKLDPAINASCSFLPINPGLTAGDCSTIWNSLGGSISFYHKSFADFLLDRRRSGIYCIRTTDDFFDKLERNLALQFEKYYCWQDSELVRAPDAPDSASSLSYPFVNEVTNTFIEACIYRGISSDSPRAADFDFRKHLYVTTSINGPYQGGHAGQIFLYGCACFRKYVHRTVLTWLQPGEFPNFNVVGFKKDLERRQQQQKDIRPYSPTSPSLNKPQARVESGLYVLGYGSKSTFWFWEIDYDMKSYREFGTIDLAEGERLYREEQFN